VNTSPVSRPSTRPHFAAFLSYSHSSDRQLGVAIKSALQRLGRSFYGLRARRIFLDQANLEARPELWPGIEEALQASDYFVLLASPAAAESKWVRREIDFWLERKGAGQFLIVLTSGDVVWDDDRKDFDWGVTTALPTRLSGVFQSEPFVLDLRALDTANRRRATAAPLKQAIAPLAARVAHIELETLVSEDARQHRNFVRAVVVTAVCLAALAIATSALAVRYQRERAIAIEQRDRAQSRAVAANSSALVTIDPQLSMILATEAFRIAPTAQASETVRQVLVSNRSVPMSLVKDVFWQGSSIGTDGFLATVNRAQAALSRPGKSVTSLDGRTILAAATSIAELRSADTGQVLHRLSGHTGTVESIALSRDGRFAATGSEDSTARLWDVTTGVAFASFPHPNQVLQVAFSGDGAYLVTFAAGALRAWETRTGHTVASLQAAGGLTDVQFSPDGSSVLVSEKDDMLTVWDWMTNHIILRVRGSKGRFSPDGRAIVAAYGPEAAIWEIATGARLADLKGHTTAITSVAFIPQGRKIATGSADGSARIWSADGVCTAQLIGHQGAIKSMAVSPDGGRLLTAADATLRLWDTRTGRLMQQFGPHGQHVLAGAFSPDATWLLSTADDGRAVRWNLRDSRQPSVPFGRAESTWIYAAISPDGSLVATGSEQFAFGPDGQPSAPVVVWDAKTGVRLFTIPDHRGVISAVAFSPTGQWLLTGAGFTDNTARVWNVNNGRAVAELRGHSGGIRGVAFHPDGDHILVGDDDGRVGIYSCDACGPTKSLIKLIASRITRQLTTAERDRYLGDDTPGTRVSSAR